MWILTSFLCTNKFIIAASKWDVKTTDFRLYQLIMQDFYTVMEIICGKPADRQCSHVGGIGGSGSGRSDRRIPKKIPGK